MVRTGVGAGDVEEPTFINCVYHPTFVRNCCTVIVFVLSENISICVADSCSYFNFICFIFLQNRTFFMVTIDDETSNE